MRRLLRARRERPCCRRAEKGDELAPLHILSKLRRRHPNVSNEYFDRAQAGQQNHCRSAQPMSLMGHSRPRPAKPKGYTRPLRPKSGQTHKRLAKSALCHEATYAPQQQHHCGLPNSYGSYFSRRDHAGKKIARNSPKKKR
jgi:hypothetical protein